MVLPSQLDEGEALSVVGLDSSIGFHRYYGRLNVVAQSKGADPRDTESGLFITDDEAIADFIFSGWWDSIENRKNGKTPSACEEAQIWQFGANANMSSNEYCHGRQVA